MRKWMGFVVLLALVGCAGGRSAQVGARMIVPPMANTMKMQEQQVFLMAEHLNPERLPAYPPALMDAGPEAARVCVDLVVGEGGNVTWAVPLRAVPDCPAAADAALAPFEQAVLASVHDWRFTAATVCAFPPGMEKNYECQGEGVTRRAVPLRMAFVFDFSRREGRGRFARAGGG